MTPSDPLLLRCLALTGSFETGLLPPGCFSTLAGDGDHMGISFSCLQWNFGQQTLQPLLRKVDLRPYFGPLTDTILHVLGLPLYQQMAWARSIQGSASHVIATGWAKAFSDLGASAAWQQAAQESAAGYFDQARYRASELGITSDRGVALSFDCCVQNGFPGLAVRHVVAQNLPDEPAKLKVLATMIADMSNPRWHSDVLSRKMCVAVGFGTVHGVQYDLDKQFGL